MENKYCSHCKTEKSLKEFHFKKTENRFSSWCKKCLYNSQMQRWADRKKKAVELLGGKCCMCGYNKLCAALDFHHVDPTQKRYEWDKLRLRKWKDVIEELKKCILVCRNCHAEIHWKETEDSKNGNNLLNLKALKSTGKCLVCQEDVYGTTYCSVECSSIRRRKTVRPTLKNLKELIESKSYCAIGREYGVSDNAVRKWARSYGLL